jgi:hypothetical protein
MTLVRSEARRKASPTVFPFVLGSGRSGTTLVRAMLDSHSRIAIPPESYFIVQMARHRERYDSAFAHRRFEAFVEDLGKTQFVWWGISESAVQRHLEASLPGTFPEAVRAVYELYSSKAGKVIFADKTPRYVLNIPLIADLFTEARFVHVIRDGRDVAMSYRDQGWGTVAQAALYWRRRIDHGQRAGRALGPDRYLELRYEQLIEDPESELIQLCSFLCIGYEPAMLEYHTHAGDMLNGTPEEANHPSLRDPIQKGLRDWRRDMAPREVQIFERLAGETLEKLHYPLSPLRPSLMARMEAGREAWRASVEQAWDAVRGVWRLRDRVAP